LHATELINQLR